MVTIIAAVLTIWFIGAWCVVGLFHCAKRAVENSTPNSDRYHEVTQARRK